MSLKHRLAVVALLCGAVCLLPTAQLGFNLLDALRTVKAQRAALPANQAWQRVIADLSEHRLASATASSHPEQAAARDAAAANTMASIVRNPVLWLTYRPNIITSY